MSCRIILQISHEAVADWEPYICIWCYLMWHFSSDDVSSPAYRCYIYFTVLIPISAPWQQPCTPKSTISAVKGCICLHESSKTAPPDWNGEPFGFPTSHFPADSLLSEPHMEPAGGRSRGVAVFLRIHWCKWCFLILVTALPRAVFSVSHSWQRCF